MKLSNKIEITKKPKCKAGVLATAKIGDIIILELEITQTDKLYAGSRARHKVKLTNMNTKDVSESYISNLNFEETDWYREVL